MKISQMSKKFTKKKLEDNKMIQLQDNNDVQFCNTTNLDNELQKNLEENENNDENVTNEQVHHNDVQLEENENNNDMLNYIPSNIYDSGNWKILTQNLEIY